MKKFHIKKRLKTNLFKLQFNIEKVYCIFTVAVLLIGILVVFPIQHNFDTLTDVIISHCIHFGFKHTIE